MNRTLLATTLAISLGLGGAAFAPAALAQTAPVGGPDAKGNAPLKHVHTVNDGSAKPGANSFTQGQARQHILNSGYTGVASLVKGKDGVWRGVAMHNGAQVDVAMDFKGNVTESAPAMAGPAPHAMATAPTTRAPMASDGAAPAPTPMADGTMAASEASSSSMTHRHHRHHHRHWRRHMHGRCANPAPNGAACSGIDRNQNGVSDKEDRAMQAGAHP